MERKKWTNKEKFSIVIEGLKNIGHIGEICNKYGICQSQYYKWRDQFLEYGDKAFENNNSTKRELLLEQRIEKMRKVIADLTMELKKNDY